MEYPVGQRTPEERRMHIASAVELMVGIHGRLGREAEFALQRYVQGRISLEEALKIFRQENSTQVSQAYRYSAGVNSGGANDKPKGR